MSKSSNASTLDRIGRAKNKVRGLFSKARDSSFGRSKEGNALRLRSGIKQCLISARAELHPEEYQEFLSWYGSLMKTALLSNIGRNAEFSHLSGFASKTPRLSLWRELRWVSKYVGLHGSIINDFVACAVRVDAIVLAGKLEEAKKEIENLDFSYGHSFWSTQLSIAIAQAVGGLEGQKARVAYLREQHRRGVLSFVSYFTGVRNEERVTWSHFKEIIELRLDESTKDNDLKTYLGAKLLHAYPRDDRGLATVLRHELSNHPFDIYASLLAVLQLIATDPSLQHNIPDAKLALDELEYISDFRLLHLRRLLSGSAFQASDADEKSSDPLDFICGKDVACAEAAFERYSPISVLAGGIAASCKLKIESGPEVSSKRLQTLISSVLVRSSGALNDIEEWQKTCRNFSGLPTFDGLRAIEEALGLSNNPPQIHSWKLMTLNGAYIDGDAAMFEPNQNLRQYTNPSESFFASIFDDNANVDTLGENLNPLSKSIARCLRFYRQKDYAALADELDQSADINSFYNKFLAPFIVEALMRTGRRKELVNFLASQIAHQSAAYSLLPTRQIASSFSKKDWQATRGNLAPLIVLHAAWRVSESEKIGANLRHQMSAFLRLRDLNKPSETIDHIDELGRAETIYFLRRICRPQFMDLISTFKTSKEVLEERSNICGILSELDPDHLEEYTVEIVRITSQLRIDKGLEAVESSRLHVDEDAFRNWAHRNVREDFERYIALVNAGLSAKSDVDHLLRTLLDELATRQVFYTPDDQSDAILIDIFDRLRRQFLTNSDFGLDYFLSKRVRHQSFIGIIRDPLEFQNLITTKDSEFGEYRENLFWRERLALDGVTDDAVQKILANFANVFDRKLIDLKDTFLQVRTNEKPEGAFAIPIGHRALFLIRTLAQQGVDFDTLVTSTIQLFWQALDPCLRRAREEIGVKLKQDLSDLLSALREDLRPVAGHLLGYPELSNAITNTSVEMQRRLDQAAGWFVRPDSQPKTDLYSLKEGVDIAIRSALTMHRAFEPNIEVSVDGDLKLQLPDLLLLWETIFVGIDNVKSHSGVKSGAKVWVKCKLSEESLMSIEIDSELARGSLSPEGQRKLNEIEQKISAKDLGHSSKTEGGSGFIKLASALNHLPSGKISFGKTKDGNFRLRVAFRPTMATALVLRVNNEDSNR